MPNIVTAPAAKQNWVPFKMHQYFIIYFCNRFLALVLSGAPEPSGVSPVLVCRWPTGCRGGAVSLLGCSASQPVHSEVHTSIEWRVRGSWNPVNLAKNCLALTPLRTASIRNFCIGKIYAQPCPHASLWFTAGRSGLDKHFPLVIKTLCNFNFQT